MKLLPVIFALCTGLFWGTYGSAVAQARNYEQNSPFKPYVMIGVAYLVWGILGGLIGMRSKGDTFSFTALGTAWGLVAGSLGAWGALSLTLAMYSGGGKTPHIVMAIIFGSAVTVSAIVSLIMTGVRPDPRLYVGIVGIAVSIATVAYYTPHGHAAPPKPKSDAPATDAPSTDAHATEGHK